MASNYLLILICICTLALLTIRPIVFKTVSKLFMWKKLIFIDEYAQVYSKTDNESTLHSVDKSKEMELYYKHIVSSIKNFNSSNGAGASTDVTEMISS